MTVSAQTPINRSTGNGVTTVFPYTFKIIAEGDIEVSVDDVVKTLNADYTVSGAGADAGGNVTMTTAPASLTTVVRRRNMALTRTTDYQDQGLLPAATLDNDIDAPVLMIQQLNERLDRTFSLPVSSSADSAMPAPTAGYVIGWDALGESLTNLPAAVGTSLVDLAASSGASLIGFLQGGFGSYPRTLESKGKEWISVLDKWDGITTDHTAAFTAAIVEANARGGADVIVPWIPGGYNIGRPNPASMRGIRVLPNVNVIGLGGVKLNLIDNCDWFYVGIDELATATITANTAITDTTLTVDSSAGFVIGDQVVVRIGQAAYDAGEVDYWYFANVTAVAIGSITLDVPCNYALNVATVTAPAQKRVIKMGNFVDGCTIEGFNFYSAGTGSANGEHGVYAAYARNLTVKNIQGTNVGAGILATQFVENLTYDRLSLDKCIRQNGQLSKGRALSIAECKNVHGGSVRGANFDGAFYVGEAGNIGVLNENFHIINSSLTRDNTQALFLLLGERSFHLNTLLVEGNKAPLTNTGGTSTTPPLPWFENATMTPTACSLSDTVLVTESAAFSGKTTLGTLILGKTKTKSLKIELLPSQADKAVLLPAGRISALKIFCSTKVGITNFYVGSGADVVQILPSNLVEGGVYTAAGNITGIGRDYALNRLEDKRIRYYTDATVPIGAYLIIEVEYFAGVEASAVDLMDGSTSVLYGSATFDPLSLPAGTGSNTSIAVSGAQVGDFVTAAFTQDLTTVVLSAWVYTAGQVGIRFQNTGASTVDLASGTLRVRVTRT